jgi:hypothetical protein
MFFFYFMFALTEVFILFCVLFFTKTYDLLFFRFWFDIYDGALAATLLVELKFFERTF